MGRVLECEGGYISQSLLCNKPSPKLVAQNNSDLDWIQLDSLFACLGWAHSHICSQLLVSQAVLLLGWLVVHLDGRGNWAARLSSSTRLAQACSNGGLRLSRTRGQAPCVRAFQVSVLHLPDNPLVKTSYIPDSRKKSHFFMGGIIKSQCKGWKQGG